MVGTQGVYSEHSGGDGRPRSVWKGPSVVLSVPRDGRLDRRRACLTRSPGKPSDVEPIAAASSPRDALVQEHDAARCPALRRASLVGPLAFFTLALHKGKVVVACNPFGRLAGQGGVVCHEEGHAPDLHGRVRR